MWLEIWVPVPRLVNFNSSIIGCWYRCYIFQVGDFAVDNRAGISRTLHRISAIRNRKGAIIGLTCRVGRAVSGSANLLRDLVKDGASLLLIGPPGVGKTTIIRLAYAFIYRFCWNEICSSIMVHISSLHLCLGLPPCYFFKHSLRIMVVHI